MPARAERRSAALAARRVSAGRGDAAGPTEAVPWHALPVEEVLARLATRPEGLDGREAAARLARHGPNRLAPAPPVPAWRILVRQLASLVVLLLFAAALVSLLLGDTLEAAAIAAVLAINTLIGFATELKARRAMEALLRFEVPVAKVIRDGELAQIPSDALVPGDVIAVAEGDRVPADARLIEAAELRTNEAPLTGESLPVDKRVDPVEDSDAPVADRASVLHSGTAVYVGRGRAVVVATGPDTELGRIGSLVASVQEGRTPLEVRLDALGRRLVWLTFGVAALVTVLGIVQGAPLGRMIETGLALAIAAVPEGLPAVATIALAVGLRRMARRNAIVRKLSAVEALGSTTVVCTDKTGTLTAGEMTVTVVVAPDGTRLRVTGVGYAAGGELLLDGSPVDPSGRRWLDALVRAAVLTSRASVAPDGRALGDPTDAALTVLGRKAGRDAEELRRELPQVRELPFSSLRRSSASFHMLDGREVAFVKGAPATVLEACTRVATDRDDRPLDAAARERLREENERLAREGLRVLALAEGEGGALDELTFLGLVGILDPPAEGVPETVRAFRDAGIRTVLITGDQRATAEAVARALGTAAEGAATLDGRALARMSEEELARESARTAVYSRVSPRDKLRIVDALQARGEIVAMLGDGVNDAAALKKAEVGVAMGRRGTDVAKETADIVLRDDRFVTIAAAIEEGRVIFDNIRKFVFYLFSCNLAEVLVLLGASVGGLPIPLRPLQILWLNLVTDTFPALALAMEPAEPGIMKRPPRRPEAAILSAAFLRAILSYAVLITAATLAAFLWGLATGEAERAITIAFVTLALAQLFHLGNARSRDPVLRPARVVANPWALAALPLVLALQLTAVHWEPLATVLGTVPLDAGAWAVALALSAMPAVIGQAAHAAGRRRRARATGAPRPGA
ncbi:MAG TPA: HAD-IC family P-type ATPase [Longimicrobiales bacterium]|nr:HAD-IC family P-type ATPase [Longimicrobiales bacterium]